MDKVVIFGIGDNAELAKYYFENDSKYEVVAFTVDKEYETNELFHGLPVVSFENLEEYYSPEEVMLFIAIGYTNMNEIREIKYLDGKKRGYKFANYLSSRANILTDKIGENNFILEDNTIQPYVEIGNNNVFWSGSHIGHHGKIGNNCFITGSLSIK